MPVAVLRSMVDAVGGGGAGFVGLRRSGGLLLHNGVEPLLLHFGRRHLPLHHGGHRAIAWRGKELFVGGRRRWEVRVSDWLVDDLRFRWWSGRGWMARPVPVHGAKVAGRLRSISVHRTESHSCVHAIVEDPRRWRNQMGVEVVVLAQERCSWAGQEPVHWRSDEGQRGDEGWHRRCLIGMVDGRWWVAWSCLVCRGRARVVVMTAATTAAVAWALMATNSDTMASCRSTDFLSDEANESRGDSVQDPNN